MGIFKSQEILKKIGNNELLISETVIVDNQDHLTNGENFILVKNNGKSNIFLIGTSSIFFLIYVISSSFTSFNNELLGLGSMHITL